MAANEIKIIIGGDASQLKAATQSANAALGTFTGLSNQTSSSLRKVATESTKTADALKKVPAAAKDLIPEKSIAEARATVKRLKDEIAGLSSSQLQSSSGKFLVSELGAAKAELKAVETQSNLTSQAVGGNLTKGFGLLRTAAAVIPGIGISGIIAAIGAVAVEVGADFLKMANAAKLAGQDMSTAFAEAEGKAAGERATLQSLLGIARNANLSQAARVEAINKLNQEYDKYLPKLTLENINTAAVTAEVDKLSASLLRQAKIKGLQDLISKETSRQAELFTKSLEDNASTIDNIVAVLKGAGAGAAGINFQRQIAGAERIGKTYKESEEKIKIFNNTLNELLTTEAKEGTLFTEKEKHQKKEEDFLKKRLEALEKIKAATQDATALVGIQESIFELQVKIAIRDQKKNGLSSGELDQQIQGFKSELQKAFEKQGLELEAIPKVRFSDVKRAEINTEEIQSKIAKAIGADKKIEITLHDVRVKLLGIKLTNQIEALEAVNKQLNDNIKNIIGKGLEDSFVALGESVGDILSGDVGGGIAGAAKKMVSIIGGVVQELGKAVIQAAVAILIAKKTIQKFIIANPALAIAVGVGLVALGGLLKNIVIDVPKLAQGGIATGPTLGIFGEAGKEAIIPLDRLPDLVGKLNVNNTANVVLNGNLRINGTDLALMLEKVDNRRRRLG